MKTLISVLLLFVFALSSSAFAYSLKYQKGYYKPSTGTYVQGHFKTKADGYKWNNRKALYGW